MGNSADLSTKAVALRFKVDPATVRKWLRHGQFPNAYVEETVRGPVWMIPESDLVSFAPPKNGRPRTRNLAADESTIAEKAA